MTFFKINSKTSQVDQNQGLFSVYLCFYKNQGLQIQRLFPISRSRGNHGILKNSETPHMGLGKGEFPLIWFLTTALLSKSEKKVSTVFHLGFRRGMAPPIFRGTLSCTPGTQLTRLDISNTHLTTVYTGRYQVLRHRCFHATSVTGVFSTVTIDWVS